MESVSSSAPYLFCSISIHTSCFILRGNITELYVYLCTVCGCFSFTKSAIPCSFSNRCLSVPYNLYTVLYISIFKKYGFLFYTWHLAVEILPAFSEWFKHSKATLTHLVSQYLSFHNLIIILKMTNILLLWMLS